MQQSSTDNYFNFFETFASVLINIENVKTPRVYVVHHEIGWGAWAISYVIMGQLSVTVCDREGRG